MMERVAVYARVSTEDQRERQSIETQIEYAKHYCQREGCFIADLYFDDGVSGTIPFDNRQAGRRLLVDAREGKFKTLLVYKIDRIGRDNLVTHEAVYKLTKLGINIKSMTEVSDRSNPQGRFIFNLFANLAEWEKELIRERTIDGKYRKARSGKFQGGGIPCGYIVNKEKLLQINETSIPGFNLSPSEVVRQIFNWIGKEGMSTIAVAERLNALGIPSPKSSGREKGSVSGKWNCDRIRNIVINTVYMGNYVYGKSKSRHDNTREKVSIPVPPIVEEELWLKAQETLKRNRKFAKRNSKHQYLLRGLIKCNFCGHSYVGQARIVENQHYYRCLRRMGYWKKIYEECPGKGKTVRREWIEGVVWNEIKNWILNPVILEEVISEKLKGYEKENGNSFKRYSKLRDSIEKKKEEKTRILELYRRGTITMEDLDKQLKAIESEQKALLQMREELKSKMIEDLPHEELLKSFREQIEEYSGKLADGSIMFEDKRRIVEKFVKEVRVNMNGRKADCASLIETIPFRKEIEPISLEDAKIVTVYGRDKNTNDKRGLQEADNSANFADVIYHFPFPPKELGVIVNPVL
jgi:site-specific DNA recombinase